ncbi:MAG: hypothetical protein KDC49_09885 [Saprospiraceae bacterium]|nr:hypothetical protein [Saprospiraceae bacterium]
MKFYVAFCLSLTTLLLYAQSDFLRISPGIVLPIDSVESSSFAKALSDFLMAARHANEENTFVFEDEKLETFILLDEINGIEKSVEFKNEHFYRPNLTNLVPLSDKTYFVQLSYIGNYEDVSILRASFELIAHKTNGSFSFSSPLLYNTRTWEIEKTGTNIFYYKNSVNREKLAEFNKLTTTFDQKLQLSNKTTTYYCCENMIELQKLIGTTYKADYNGKAEGVFSAALGDRKLIILGNNNARFDHFDPHDLWHDRLSLLIPRSQVNKRVDEGCAYLYGGSWGFTWEEIYSAFMNQIANNRKTDWMETKDNQVYFKTGQYQNHADYIVNALLVKKIEKEKGFGGVWELLTTGPYEKGSEKYFQVLESLTGINKANYNEKVWELINGHP